MNYQSLKPINMEKQLYKKYTKKGEFTINYLPKTFIVGYTQSGGYRYLVLGFITFEWFGYSQSKTA
jgi:hypothetical protein